MADARREDQENLKALESLSSAASPPRPTAKFGAAPAAPKPGATPAPAKPATAPAAAKPSEMSANDAGAPRAPALPPLMLPSAAAPPPAPAMPPRASVVPSEGEPLYRCLNCGYPIPEGGALRCNECGRTYEQEVLDAWFSGEEAARFEHVIWLVLGCLFLKLLLLPDLLRVSRVGTAVVIAWACHLAMRNKAEGPGRFCAIGGLAIAVLMAFGFAWLPNPLAYYTFDMVAGCLLLLAMLHHPTGGHIGGVTLSRRLAPVILFAAPLFALGCWQLEALGIPLFPATVAPPPGSASGPGTYDLFAFIIPYLAAGGVWLFVWRALARMRKMLFGTTET